MSRWREAFFVFLSFFVASQDCACASPVRVVITYIDPLGTTATQIGPHSASVDGLDANRSLSEPNSMESGIAVSAGDCSDREFACFRMSNVVFAVPRTGLLRSSAYTFNGVAFKVAKCYRQVSGKCALALIESNCMWVKAPPRCSPFPRGRDESPRPGPVAYYIYDNEHGVTEFGLGGDTAPNIESAERVARMNLLQGDRGLLLSAVYSPSDGR